MISAMAEVRDYPVGVSFASLSSPVSGEVSASHADGGGGMHPRCCLPPPSPYDGATSPETGEEKGKTAC